MNTRSFALSSLTVHPPQRTRPWRAPYVFRLLLFAFCSLTVYAFGAEASMKAEPDLKKVVIHKQSGTARNNFGKNTRETFLVEVIRDKEGLKKGLSFRDQMPEDHGMLFVLDTSQDTAFWMKGMKFPLDIIFIDQNMQIIEILENLQPCEKCPVYFPRMRPAYGLELNAGLARKFGFTPGDTVVFEK